MEEEVCDTHGSLEAGGVIRPHGVAWGSHQGEVNRQDCELRS